MGRRDGNDIWNIVVFGKGRICPGDPANFGISRFFQKFTGFSYGYFPKLDQFLHEFSQVDIGGVRFLVIMLPGEQ